VKQPVTRDQLRKLTPLSMPEPLPAPARRWSDDEWAVICQGHRARGMDDKWHAFVEDNRLFLHRSWTGDGIYEAQFVRGQRDWSISELFVCGDRTTYRRARSNEDEAMFAEAIIDGVLLGNWDNPGWARFGSAPRV
jgi:hypothetical protein